MKFYNLSLFIIPLVWFFGMFASSAQEPPVFSALQWQELNSGKVVLLGGKSECTFSQNGRRICGAILVKNSCDKAWALLNAPEEAPSFCDDMVSAKILSSNGSTMVVEQGMKVPGFSKPLTYTVTVNSIPKEKISFELLKGQFRGLDGGWWLYKGKNPEETLLIYSLFLDPGKLAPQAIVRSSLRKKIPETLIALRSELYRRSAASQ